MLKWYILWILALLGMLACLDLGYSLHTTCPSNQSVSADGGASAQPKKNCSIKESATYSAATGFVHLIESGEKFLIALSTVVIAAFTIVLGIATAFLWTSTREMVSGAKDTAERQLRAYVSITNCEAFAGQGDGAVPRPERRLRMNTDCVPTALVSYKNTGQTPARNVVINGNAILTGWPINESDLLLSAAGEASSVSTIGGSLARELPVQPAGLPLLTEAQVNALLNGELTFVVFGRITYDDIFGRERWTDFRYFIGGPVPLASRGLHMVAHQGGNEET